MAIFLSQEKYVADLLLKASLIDCKSCSIPLAVKSFASPTDSLPFSQPSSYRTIVGGLQYLTITRPDLALAVNMACQHIHSPSNFQDVK